MVVREFESLVNQSPNTHMNEPYCPDCGVVQDLHSGIYCGIVKQEREKHERKLELVREMNRMLRRDIDSLEDQGGIIDQARADLEEMKQKSDAREADMKSLEENRDEWKQACEKVTADRNDWQKAYNSLPVTKRIQRISELCSTVAVQSRQITDLTTERDSLKSMYQSSEAMNAGLLKEHNELKAAYEKLACSQPTPAELLTSQMSKLISSMNDAGAAAVRPAPGRLEIAAMVLAGMLHDSDTWSMEREESAEYAVELADTLIKADQA